MTSKTPQQVMREWIDALRSGKYQKTQGRLRVGDRFDCLGVLCELNVKDGGARWQGERYMGFYTTLPFPIGDWMGLSLADATALNRMNDVENKDFNAIADVLERRLLWGKKIA